MNILLLPKYEDAISRFGRNSFSDAEAICEQKMSVLCKVCWATFSLLVKCSTHGLEDLSIFNHLGQVALHHCPEIVSQLLSVE